MTRPIESPRHIASLATLPTDSYGRTCNHRTTDKRPIMDEQIHHFLNTLIPRPLYFLLAQFSNFIYRTFLGLYNDPTSWKSTLLPPLIALVTGYLALLTAFRTLRSTIALIWFSIKWGAIVGIGLAVYSWWVGESGAIHSAGQPGATGGAAGGILGAVIDGAARGTSVAFTIPFL